MNSIKQILIFVLLSTAFNILGQKYQTVNSKRISYFDNQNNPISCIRIDSVKHNTDSVLYPFCVIQKLDYDCYSPNTASWIGKMVIIRDDGVNYFFNKNNDSITIKTSAKIGEQWIAYKIADSLVVKATVIKHDTLSFLGLTDSVKTIGFRTFDRNMQPLNFEINNLEIKISKNYGFVKTLNFYLFPNLQDDYQNEQIENYNLIGISTPKVGVQNLTWLDVNDFQVGDELHILDEWSCWSGFGSGSGSATTNKVIFKYLERKDYSDSIIYQYSRKQSIYTTWTDRTEFKYYNDTLVSIIKPDSMFDKLPGEPVFLSYGIYTNNMENSTPISKSNSKEFDLYLFTGNSCWRMIIADGCLSANTYIKGLGGPYYSCMQSFCFGGADRKLVYFKKGNTTWGSPLTITKTTDIEVNKHIVIYPNPAIDNVNIRISDIQLLNSTINIYDIHGRIQKLKKLETDNSKLDISDLLPGVYIVKITNNQTVVKLEKLIVK